VKVAEYQDDECIRDMPNYPSGPDDEQGKQTWRDGWSNQNAQFVGQTRLNQLISSGSYTMGVMCVKASRSGCNGGCATFDVTAVDQAQMDNYGTVGMCSEYGSLTYLERLILFFSGACACASPGPNFVNAAIFGGPVGTDGKDLLGCTANDYTLYPGSHWGCQYGWSWHYPGYAVTMKNSDVVSHGLGVGDEVASMWHDSSCAHMSADTQSNVDSFWLYLGQTNNWEDWNTAT
jgi:hypothetical protein